MTISDLIALLEPIAQISPDMLVLLGRGSEGWFDEVEEVGTCRVNRDRDGLHCGTHQLHDDGLEVLVIH